MFMFSLQCSTQLTHQMKTFLVCKLKLHINKWSIVFNYTYNIQYTIYKWVREGVKLKHQFSKIQGLTFWREKNINV